MFKSKSYCYPPPNELTLRNKFGIKDFDKAMALERDITSANMTDVNKITGYFDAKHLKAVHKHLFHDMYNWAGKFRTEDIWKNGTSFCPASQIESRLKAVAEQLKPMETMKPGISKDDAADFMALYFRNIDYVHAFREGNGRTERVIMVQMAKQAGFELSFKNVTKDDWITASKLCRYGHMDMIADVFKSGLIEAYTPPKGRYIEPLDLEFKTDTGYEYE